MLSYLRTRGKSLSVLSFFILAIAVLISSTLLGHMIFNKWFGILAGIILTVFALLCHLILGSYSKLGHLFSFLLNTVGAGFSVSAYYTVKGVECQLEKLILGATPAILVLALISLLMLRLQESKHILIVIFAVLELGLIIASIVLWVNIGADVYAFTFFSLLQCAFYTGVLAVTADEDERGVIRDCSFGSFGFFLLATVIVIAILLGAMGCDDCSCDGADCGDCCDCDTKASKKSKKFNG